MKTIPCPVAHPSISHLREYPPSFYRSSERDATTTTALFQYSHVSTWYYLHYLRYKNLNQNKGYD